MPTDARERLDHYLVRLGWARSRRAAREMLAGGMVRVNGRVLRKGEMVGGGDAVEIADISTLPALVPDPEVKIEILFRDSAMLVVNKPAPMACHPLRPGERGTVMNGVVAAFPDAASAGDNPREGGLVHRLDNGTSGALLVALRPVAFSTLREAIRAGRVRRDYQALVVGHLKESLEIEKSLAHDPRNARRMMPVAANAAGAQVRHMMVNVSFDVHGDHAHGTCNLIYFHIKSGKTELAAVGGYRDELRKINGNWQFAHRQVYVDK